MARDIVPCLQFLPSPRRPPRASRLRRMAAVAALLLVCGAAPAVAATGYWTITGYLAGPDSAMDAATAESYKGKRVFLDAESIEFDAAACAISPTLTDHDTVAYFSQTYHVTPEFLGHKAPKVFVIETGCDLPGLGTLLLLDDGRMCFARDGVFFFMSEELE